MDAMPIMMCACRAEQGNYLSLMRAICVLTGNHGTSMVAFLAYVCATYRVHGLLQATLRASLRDIMARRERRSIQLIIIDAERALHMTQKDFGIAIGASQRTAARWAARQSSPAEHHLRTLAGLLYPVDRTLAAEVADFIDESLVSLGLETPPPPPAPPPAPPPPLPPQPPPVRAEDLVDVLVLSAVERTGAAPAPMRALLHAVFKRAREVGLTVEAAEKALHAGVAADARTQSGAG
jgi:DNA-binding transcriptional regulator YiaG